VIADSEHAHLRAFQRILSDEGITLTEKAYFDRYLAMDDRGCLAAVFKDAGRAVSPEALRALAARKSRAYLDEVASGIKLIPGGGELARALSRRFPCAMASGALRHEIDLVIKAANLSGVFRSVVTAEDVSRGKPDPESYMTALARLNAELLLSPQICPEECLVIEDSIHGITAAIGAGMRCLAITTSYDAEAIGKADLVVSSFVGLEIETLTALFSQSGHAGGNHV
jgi:HAD superfamily hydrolase (TIGR01509 family)